MAAVRWVHHDSSPQDLLQIVKQLAQDQNQGNQPVIQAAKSHGDYRAACYFRLLPGNVATLGGIRAAKNAKQEAAEQLVRIYQELKNCGCAQVQAIVDQTDQQRLQLLSQAGFSRLTSIQQLLRLVKTHATSTVVAHDNWIPVQHFSESDLEIAIEKTFHGTLDCPLLNGLRSARDVLQGFLEGKPLAAQSYWECLSDRQTVTSVLFLTKHSSELFELCYMGVIPEFRGKGMGAKLVERALEIVSQAGGQYLALGVDSDNWPALRVYHRFGFANLNTKVVLFHEQDLQAMKTRAFGQGDSAR